MILVDANLLIYASVAQAEQHSAALRWLDARMTATQRVGLPWPSLLGFLRVVTNPRILRRPVPMTDAWATVRGWLAVPVVWTPQPTPAHADVLEALMPAAGTARLVPDAHLAALAIEHGLTLCSNDGDFARFEGLRWENPIAS